jgi:DNA-binding IclR family transcriptional regulator
MSEGDRPGGVSTTVQRATRLLFHLADRPEGYGITELARLLNTFRAPLYKILSALIECQLVRRTDDGRYVLGVATLRLAQAYSSLFPAQVEEALAQIANETGLTATVVSVDDDVYTAVLSEVPATSGEHVYTPPGFKYTEGPLAMRIAYKAAQPASPDDTPDITQARAQGYATGSGAVMENRYSIATLIPTTTRRALVLVLVGLTAFDYTHTSEPLTRAAHLIGYILQRRK